MIVAEIGLNHLGDKTKLNKYLSILKKNKIKAITIQIREKSFYIKHKKLFLNDKIHKNFFKKAKKDFLVGIALCDIKKLNLIKQSNLDFIKILSKDFTNFKFVKSILLLKKETYLSIGNYPISEIKKFYKKYKNINNRIKLIYTCFENQNYKLNLNKIKFYKNLFKTPVSYGNHHNDQKKIIQSVKYKPESIFFYIKDCDNNIYPDNDHAVNLNEIYHLVKKINEYRLQTK